MREEGAEAGRQEKKYQGGYHASQADTYVFREATWSLWNSDLSELGKEEGISSYVWLTSQFASTGVYSLLLSGYTCMRGIRS